MLAPAFPSAAAYLDAWRAAAGRRLCRPMAETSWPAISPQPFRRWAQPPRIAWPERTAPWLEPYLPVLPDAEDLGIHFGADLYEREVTHLVENEWAMTADDILWRRTKLGLRLSERRAPASPTGFPPTVGTVPRQLEPTGNGPRPQPRPPSTAIKSIGCRLQQGCRQCPTNPRAITPPGPMGSSFLGSCLGGGVARSI